MNELAELTKLVADKFKDDPTVPSVVFAWLEAKQSWYISIVRYDEKFGKGKKVVSNFMNPDLDFTMSHMLNAFKESYVAVS